MTPAEAAVLLAKIAANDNREVTEAAARAWAEALPDVALVDALTFLPSFYRNATRDAKNWIYPGDVLNGVSDMHRKQRASASWAARQAVFDAAGEEADFGETYEKAHRAQLDAITEYNRKHTVPQIEAPKARNWWDS